MLFRDMKLTSRKIPNENGLLSTSKCLGRGACWGNWAWGISAKG